jgi:predicted dehydrogenase
VEKPAGAYSRQVREMNEAAEKSDRVFSIMFDWRTRPLYQKVKSLVAAGELGDLKQNLFITTAWYRSQSYYDSGGWRATWGGEGGGVLMNQAPHHLDLWQWICGVPSRVRAFCRTGVYHEIEVEDDVTAYVEYENGSTGVFVTSTGITPGTTRWEIAGNSGRIVVEDERLTFSKLDVPERQFNRDYKGGFGEPKSETSEIPTESKTSGTHQGITSNWVQTILKGSDRSSLLSPGAEGVRSLEIANAMYLSSWLDQWVELPVDADLYFEELRKRARSSRYRPGPHEVAAIS